MLKLEVKNGHFAGLAIEVSEGVTVGRGQDSGLFIPDPQVSRLHARIFKDGGRYWVADQGSHNGTFVNDIRTEGNRVLRHGDLVQMGNSLILVTLEGEEARDSGAIRIEQDNHEVTMTLERSVVELAPPSLESLRSERAIDGFHFSSLADLRKASDRSLSLILSNARRFAILFHIARTLQESTQTERLLANMMDYVFKVMGADRGDIVLVGERNELFPVLSVDRKGNLSDTVRISRTVSARVLESNLAVISTDARSDPRLASSESVIMYGMRSIMCVPMISKEKVVGLVQVVNDRDFAAFGEDDLYLLTVFASLAAVSVENTRLYEKQQQAIVDLRAAHTELVRTQEELVQRERLASVGQMASGIAHEIRNTLGPIALVHLIRERHPDDSTLASYVELITESHKRILTIIDEVRNFSKGETGTFEAKEQSIQAMLGSVLRFLKYDKDVKAVNVKLDADRDFTAAFNLDRVKQVIINLVRNAAQALVDGKGEVRVRVSGDDRFARVEVMDTGRGIPKDDLQKIWVPFFSTKGEKGMGLGLDISRMIVEQHGGQIECMSEVGVGTVMTVSLPRTLELAEQERIRHAQEKELAAASLADESLPLHIAPVEDTKSKSRHTDPGPVE